MLCARVHKRDPWWPRACWEDGSSQVWSHCESHPAVYRQCGPSVCCGQVMVFYEIDCFLSQRSCTLIKRVCNWVKRSRELVCALEEGMLHCHVGNEELKDYLPVISVRLIYSLLLIQTTVSHSFALVMPDVSWATPSLYITALSPSFKIKAHKTT